MKRPVFALAVLLVACGDHGGRGAPSAAPSASVAAVATSSSAPIGTPSESARAGASSPATIEACGRYAAGRCAKEKACFPFRFDTEHASIEACVRAVSATCAAEMAPPKSGATPATLDACLSATTASCDALLAAPPESCHPAGETPTGGPCSRAAECVGGYCDREPDARCGVCAELPKQHEACAKGVLCEYGSSCEGGHCFRRAEAGEPCDASSMCRAPLRCFHHECVAPAKEHEACDDAEVKAPACDEDAGLYCAARTCAPRKRAKLGERCGAAAACVDGRHCGRKGVCEASAKEGDPCSPSGPFCDAPAACTRGICAVPAATCP